MAKKTTCHNSETQETVIAKKANSRKRPLSTYSITPSNDSEEQETEEIRSESQPSNATCSGPLKKKGRGGAKGEKGHGMPADIHDGRIITPQATRAIFPLFKQELTGPYTTWSQYKKQENNLTRVYERWQECNFKFTCSEKDIKNAFEKHIENRYPDWEIYQKVIGGPSHGRVLGLGAGDKLKDYISPNQTCNKPTCLEQKEDYERVKGQVESLTNKLDELTKIVQSLLPITSDNSKARISYSVDNIATDSSAHHDEDGTDEDDAENAANLNEDFY